jgi:cytochrome c oxidase subunit 3
MGTDVLDPPHDSARGGPPVPPTARRGGRGPGGDGDRRRQPSDPHRIAVLGMWVALVPIGMLFMAFVSAYIVRQGVGGNWIAGPVPAILWVNTILLGASSFALEAARRRVRDGRSARPFVLAAFFLGLAFVAGQVFAWLDLRASGIGIAASPHTSFFYLMTIAHALHVAGGMVALVLAAIAPPAGFKRAPMGTLLHVTAIYWHFLLVLWLLLFALLRFWR